jgi:putative oxidoreductase
MYMKAAIIAARSLMAMLFILAGVGKLVGPQPFIAHMTAHGLPGELLPLVAAFEIVAGIGVLIGWRVAWPAAALGIFCVATAFVFHLDWSSSAERSIFFKDLAIAGGLFCLALANARDFKRSNEMPALGGRPLASGAEGA